MSAELKEIIASIRQVIADCEERQATFERTGRQSDYRAWKRKGGALEVWSVGHIRHLMDGYEAADTRITSLEEENARLREALSGALGALEQDLDTGREYGDADWEGIAFQRLQDARAALSIRGEG